MRRNRSSFRYVLINVLRPEQYLESKDVFILILVHIDKKVMYNIDPEFGNWGCVL